MGIPFIDGLFQFFDDYGAHFFLIDTAKGVPNASIPIAVARNPEYLFSRLSKCVFGSRKHPRVSMH
jgi:hypothetical protein